MKRVQLLAHLDGVARVRAALKSHDDVGAIGEEIDDFPLAFVPELGTDNDRRGHPNRRRNIASGLMVLYRRHDGHSRWRFPSAGRRDRKSTRLNSSHRCISYAVFCLKKK